MLVIWSITTMAGVVPTSNGNQKLRWKSGAIRISISPSLARSAPNIKSDSDVTGAIRRSIDAWTAVADISLVQDTSDRLSVSAAGVAGDGVSLISIAATPENVLFFGKGDDATAAKTRVFFNRRGFITEADIVLSPFQQFSTDGTYGTFDLEATLKHEIGHLLGLGHSSVVGSMMYDVSAKNGVFGENGLAASRITQDDIAAIRDLYGVKADENCCGVLTGRLTGIAKTTRNIDVWLKEKETGRVSAHGTTSRDGNFRIGGLEAGPYEVSVRENGRFAEASLLQIGDVTIDKGSTVSFLRKLVRQPRNFSVELLGKNGVLSDSPLKLRRGNAYTLYLGGKNLSSARLQVETSSPFLIIDVDSIADQAYDGRLSGLSFELTVDGETPSGTYNLCAVSDSGSSDCIVGGISIVD